MLREVCLVLTLVVLASAGRGGKCSKAFQLRACEIRDFQGRTSTASCGADLQCRAPPSTFDKDTFGVQINRYCLPNTCESDAGCASGRCVEKSAFRPSDQELTILSSCSNYRGWRYMMYGYRYHDGPEFLQDGQRYCYPQPNLAEILARDACDIQGSPALTPGKPTCPEKDGVTYVCTAVTGCQLNNYVFSFCENPNGGYRGYRGGK